MSSRKSPDGRTATADFSFKIVVIGDSGTGKTTLVNRQVDSGQGRRAPVARAKPSLSFSRREVSADQEQQRGY